MVAWPFGVLILSFLMSGIAVNLLENFIFRYHVPEDMVLGSACSFHSIAPGFCYSQACFLRLN